MTLTLTGDDVTPQLAQLASQALQKQMVLGMGTAVQALAQRAFRDASARPAPWPARRGGGSHPLLLKSGTLRQSLHVVAVGADTVKVGSPAKYAALQQLGGTILPKSAQRLVFTVGGKKVFAKKVTLPARPFLSVLNGKLTAQAERGIAEALQGLLEQGR